ncbi:hypothetical protein AZF37_06540 [endosymbiont 'TC1' of Trimyema compressum]|uniref:hypothetical protein n=1 Tax=endosymbiont 'TC1' of Trimyema compressum TaxID=243899 RepID=UPI0007F08C3F|nr:hypothetical protein [endosymbiont 'TC1' of Trimyema compressum]AMP20870.1 hypothetical protein AZF37_06540 [endosymbiont 'TC1' of Trimyema compressum]
MKIREERVLATLGLIMIIIMTCTIYFGLNNVVNTIDNMFVVKNANLQHMLTNMMTIEQFDMWTNETQMRTIYGIIISFSVLVGLVFARRNSSKMLKFSGVIFLLSGLAEMILLGTSIIGWTAGPMLMIAGFLCVYNSKNHF